jgi:3-oxoacyl-[acyl-carrier protein] reductase
VGKLDGKVAIVTGAGRGIGRAIVEKLGADGARVMANDLDAEPLNEAVSEIAGTGAEVAAFAGDVTRADFGDAIVEATLARFGDLHIIVNNAGYIWNSAALKHTDEQWQAMYDVHATAPFRILRAAGAHFRDISKRGEASVTRKIVNVSSVSGVYGAPTQLSYSAAKAAVVGMTKTLCKEWGRYNVTVNCVAFGYIETRLTQTLHDGPQTINIKGAEHPVGLDPASAELSVGLTPLQRAGTPADAAGAVYLLCIPESDFISGQVLVVSGGLEF